MNIAFRVDASSQIGTGHFMRCLTLADALHERGAQIRFISRRLPEYLQTMLVAKGHEDVLLRSGSNADTSGDLFHSHWLGTSQQADAQDTIQALSGQSLDWLVVDHYALDVRWESELRQTARNILVIDDLADRVHDCDVLLDQNFYANMDSRHTNKVPKYCRLLLGPRYALLREEFRQMREQVKPRTGPVKRILVFFGGVDTDNYTGRAIEALVGIGVSDFCVDVVIGAQHPFREQLEHTCVQHGFTCHVQTTRMAELMAAADLAIGAGGSATWERCCLGLPTLTICVAENQSKQIADAASEVLLYAPELGDGTARIINLHMKALMENAHLRYALSRNGMQAVDECGTMRVVGELGCSGIEMREARNDDIEKLFEWRNHPDIRAFSRSADLINWENHKNWFTSVLTSPDKLLIIGMREEAPVGVVRFDIQDNEAEISIYLVPDSKGQGQGRDLLKSAESWLADNQPNVSKINAYVLGGNERSRHLFSWAGYQVESTCYSKRLY